MIKSIMPAAAREYSVLGNAVQLQPHRNVFSPSSHGLSFGKILRVHKHETCADIGCGSGIFAIAAAMNGAVATAIDPNPSALRATQKNAALNGVSVYTVDGYFFANLRRKFDVIIANLPQDIIPPKRLTQLTPEEKLAICGGAFGDEAMLQLLGQAVNHMHEESRLYVPVYTGARYSETQKVIDKNFDVAAKHTATVECKDHVSRNIAFYRQLLSDGIIDIFYRRGKWRAHQFEYELRKK